MKLLLVFSVLSAGLITPGIVSAQTQSETNPPMEFCDPLIAASLNEVDKDDNDEEELERVYRYDQEQAVQLTTRVEIMNALFEEKWNFETNEPIARYELCGAEESYVVLWSNVLRTADAEEISLAAEGYMSIRKDGTFELNYSKRPYIGTWELDDADMVLTADWLNEGNPYRTPVEFVQTPVETVDGSGVVESYIDEVYRLGGFRFYRLPTTVKGREQACSCENQDR